MQIYADICRYELRANHEFCDVLCQVTEADFSTFPLSSSFRIWSEETQASDPWAILGREIQVSTCSSYFFLFNIAFHWQMAERVFYVTSMLELMRTKTPYVLSSYDFPSSAGKKQDQRDHLHLKDSWNSLDLPPPRMPVINRNPQLNLYLPLASWVGGRSQVFIYSLFGGDFSRSDTIGDPSRPFNSAPPAWQDQARDVFYGPRV